MASTQEPVNEMAGLSYALLKKRNGALGYPFYDNGDYNLNIIGIRTDDARTNLFNDWMCLAFRQNDHEQLMVFACTTDPGTYWLKHPMNVDGTAVLKPGHYPLMFKLGMHRGKYLALVQAGPCTVWRDNNQDKKIDTDGETQSGSFGINLHRASPNGASSQVDKWSAGCQVIADSGDFDLFMEICKRGGRAFGKFSYTLMTEQQLWGSEGHP